LTHDKWRDLKPDSGAGTFNWVKSAISGGKGENQDALHQNINFILSSSPMWDRYLFVRYVTIITLYIKGELACLIWPQKNYVCLI
jgi:hypothetical protein